MPIIGEIVQGKQIGKRCSNKFMWSSCSVCGIERWVRVINGKLENNKCTSCGKMGKRSRPSINPDYIPQIGEIRYGDEIGYKYHKQRYIWEECSNCGVPRWCQYPSKLKYNKCRKCLNKGRIGELSGTWKGGTKINHSGYRLVILRPDDPYYPMANVAGYVMEHRLIIAKQLGRCLEEWELVHHKGINYPIESRRNKSDNVPENLEHIGIKGEHNTLVEATLIRQAKYIKAQDNRIEGLESRVTLLEAELTVFRMDMSEFI
jgi:hypothetical protein